MIPIRALLPVLVALAWSASAPGQLVPLTTSGTSHSAPEISPDGLQVAFKVGLEKIGTVSLTSGIESTLVNSPAQNLFDFLWSPTSSAIYYLQGNLVRSIPRSGGVPVILGTLQGIDHALWCVDGTDTTIFGTRREGSTYYIFVIDTSGGFAPKDIVSSVNVLDDVRVDPSGTSILYRSWPAIPFTAKEYYRADVDGQNQTLLHTTDPLDQAQSAVWTDDGQTFALTMLSATNSSFELARFGSSGLELLTETENPERRSTVSRDGKWLLFESGNPKGGITLAVMPTVGGGLVLLAAGQRLVLNGGFLTGGLSMDENNELVAFSALDLDLPGVAEQIYVARLNREIRIYPRVELGGDLTVELPIDLNELGAVAFSTGFAMAPPIIVPGISGAFELLAGPGELATALVGFGLGTGPLTSQLTVPNDPTLAGLEIYFQGVRLQNAGQGEFTNWGWFTIF